MHKLCGSGLVINTPNLSPSLNHIVREQQCEGEKTMLSRLVFLEVRAVYSCCLNHVKHGFSNAKELFSHRADGRVGYC